MVIFSFGSTNTYYTPYISTINTPVTVTWMCLPSIRFWEIVWKKIRSYFGLYIRVDILLEKLYNNQTEIFSSGNSFTNFCVISPIKYEHFRIFVELFICFDNLAWIQILIFFLPYYVHASLIIYNNNVSIIMQYWQMSISFIYNSHQNDRRYKKSGVQL